MTPYYSGVEQDALDYIKLQERQKRLLEEFEQNNPSLFSRMMKAGLFAVLGALGAGLLDQDPVKGAATGALASFLLPQGKKERPPSIPTPPYRL